MEPQTNLIKKMPNKLFLISILAFVLILGSYLIVKNKKKVDLKNSQVWPTSESTLMVSPTVAVNENVNTKGSLNFNLFQSNFEINKPFNLVIKADSGGESVVSMDILIKFDKNKIKFLNAKSTLKELTVYQSTIDDYLNLTLVKNLNVKWPVYFNNNPIVELQFSPIVKENISLQIVQKYKNRKTFFVNEKSEVLSPQLPEKLLINVK